MSVDRQVDLPTPSALIAGLADGTLAIGELAGFEVAKIVGELMRRNAELEEDARRWEYEKREEAIRVTRVIQRLTDDRCTAWAELATAIAERDALLRHCVRHGTGVRAHRWFGMVRPDQLGGPDWETFDTEAGAIEAVRRAAGIGEQGED